MLVTGLFNVYALLFGIFSGILATVVNGAPLGGFRATFFRYTVVLGCESARPDRRLTSCRSSVRAEDTINRGWQEPARSVTGRSSLAEEPR